MAKSYNYPGRECSVAEFDALARTGKVGAAWKGFCDCMFNEPFEITELIAGSDVYFVCKNGNCFDPKQVQDKSLAPPVTNEVTAAKLVYDAAVARGVEYKLRVSILETKTPDWQKCMGVFCTLPWGCPHPDFPDVKVPFNVGPHVIFAPWTELGAAARGIPKRGAGVFYTIGQVFTIDLSQYEPINLWKNKMTNPALYALNAWKLNLIPTVGTALANILNAPDFIAIPALAAAALTQCAAEGKDSVKYIFKPALTGGISNIGFALKIIGPALGQQYFSVAGIALAKYSQDQIDSGEVDKPTMAPIVAGTIRFFAESGESIGTELQKALGNGFSLKSASSIFRLFEAGFGAIASAPQLDDEARRVFTAMRNAMRVIAAAATGFEDAAKEKLGPADTAFLVADKIVFELFGFSLSELKRTVTQGGAQVSALLETAKRKGKMGTLEGLAQALEAIVAAISKVAEIISDISKALDGALDKFAAQFIDMKAAVTTARDDTAVAFAAASGGLAGVGTQFALPAGKKVGVDTGLVVKGGPGTGPSVKAQIIFGNKPPATKQPQYPDVERTPPRTQPPAPPPPPKAPPPPPKAPPKAPPSSLPPSSKKAASSMNLAPFVGGAIGALFGGPIGAAAGIAAGAALGSGSDSKPSTKPISHGTSASDRTTSTINAAVHGFWFGAAGGGGVSRTVDEGISLNAGAQQQRPSRGAKGTAGTLKYGVKPQTQAPFRRPVVVVTAKGAAIVDAEPFSFKRPGNPPMRELPPIGGGGGGGDEGGSTGTPNVNDTPPAVDRADPTLPGPSSETKADETTANDSTSISNPTNMGLIFGVLALGGAAYYFNRKG